MMQEEKNLLTENLLTTEKSEPTKTQDRFSGSARITAPKTKGPEARRIHLISNTPRIQPSRRGLSIGLYFIFLRSSFIMFSLLALMKLYPLYIVVSYNCKHYRDIHGEVQCPLSFQILFNTDLFQKSYNNSLSDDNKLEFESYYGKRYLSRFRLRRIKGRLSQSFSLI